MAKSKRTWVWVTRDSWGDELADEIKMWTRTGSQHKPTRIRYTFGSKDTPYVEWEHSKADYVELCNRDWELFTGIILDDKVAVKVDLSGIKAV